MLSKGNSFIPFVAWPAQLPYLCEDSWVKRESSWNHYESSWNWWIHQFQGVEPFKVAWKINNYTSAFLGEPLQWRNKLQEICSLGCLKHHLEMCSTSPSRGAVPYSPSCSRKAGVEPFQPSWEERGVRARWSGQECVSTRLAQAAGSGEGLAAEECVRCTTAARNSLCQGGLQEQQLVQPICSAPCRLAELIWEGCL